MKCFFLLEKFKRNKKKRKEEKRRKKKMKKKTDLGVSSNVNLVYVLFEILLCMIRCSILRIWLDIYD